MDSQTSFSYAQSDTRCVPFASEDDGERGAPGAGADDSDLAHALAPFLLPKRLSVPARRRRMFWWCLAMMRAAAPTVAITRQRAMLLPIEQPREDRKRGGRYDRSERNVTRDVQRWLAKISSTTSTALGARARNEPTPVATPLPPLNFSQTERCVRDREQQLQWRMAI